MMQKKQSKFHTDAFTRGGQIFAHEWRMKLQNYRIVFLVALIPGFLGLILAAACCKLSLWLVWDFYIFTYLSGKIKIFLWPSLQPFLIDFDVFLRGLMKGSKGIPSAYASLPRLISEVQVPGRGRLVMSTLKFLNHPWVKAQASQVNTVLLWGLGSFLAGLFAMGIGFRRKSQNIEKDKILRGKKIEGANKVAQKVKKLGKPNFEIAPGLPLLKGSENQHIAIMGATRMGKTTCILHLLEQVRKQGHRAVILDSTGELTKRFYRSGQDILISPFEERSVSWDIWGEHLDAYEYDAWAAAMIPEGKGDPIWHGNARKLLAFTAQKLKDFPNSTMKDILKWCCWEPLGKEVSQFYQGSPVSALMRPEAEKTAVGVRMQAGNSIASFEYLSEARTPFSITSWVKENKDRDSWLFLMAKPTQRATLAPFLSSLFGFSFIGLEKSGEDFKNRLWMVADEVGGWEFPIAALKRVVTEGAKYGACCVLGFQNKSQIDHLYHHSGTKTLLSNCSTKVIFRSQDHETAKDLSLTLGEQDILSSNEGFSMGSHHMRDGVNLSANYRTQATISATDIMSLEQLEAYILLSGNLPATKVRFSPLSSVP